MPIVRRGTIGEIITFSSLDEGDIVLLLSKYLLSKET